VPLLILLIIFLTAFGVSGLLIQALTRSIAGAYWPGVVAAVPALVLALPAVRAMGGLFARVVPRDETTAVSEDSLVGRVAVVTVGVAAGNAPAEGRVRDEHGQTHYVMVEPDIAGETFPAGTEVLLVKRAGAKFFAIRNPSPALSDRGA
jgi:membrane protein implicated in regulation of membrane protease activity